MRIKIGFYGPQGSGKTTRAYELATFLKKQGYDVFVLSEVARSCPLPINEKVTREAQLWILGKQLTREQSSKGQILVSDRTLLDAFAYSMRTDPEFFMHLKPFMKEYMKTYDAIVNCRANDEYLIDDGIRSANKEFRDEIDSIMKGLVSDLSVETIGDINLDSNILEIIKNKE